MASVLIRGVEKQFGRTQVLRGVDISVPDGSFTALVGPSGCGKSTLLRLIAGLEELSAGEIRIGDTVVNRLPPKARDVAMVFQNYALYPHMTVRENLGFSLLLAKEPKSTIANKVDRVAENLSLTELLDRYPRQLSGGQRQRVAMGRAIVRAPRVFLFDEPLSNLDAQLRVALRAEIKLLYQRLKTTAIYVTHDQIEAMTLADQIVVMRDGRIEQTGAPLELYDRPQSQFVASFIGSPCMNFLPGKVQRAEHGQAVLLQDGTRLPLAAELRAEPDQPVLLGVRPEHLRLVSADGSRAESSPADGSTAESIAASVKLVENTGADTLVGCEHQGHPLCLLLRERHSFQSGSTIRIAADPARLHVFDAASGQRLDSGIARLAPS
jgi:multiple sugar transport system ATP-binding protein